MVKHYKGAGMRSVRMEMSVLHTDLRAIIESLYKFRGRGMAARLANHGGHEWWWLRSDVQGRVT